MLAQLLDEVLHSVQGTDVTELELRTGDYHIRLVRSIVDAISPPDVRSLDAKKDAQPQTQPPRQERPVRPHVIHAPMYGTFYRAPTPDQEPFVTEGQKVKVGQQLALLEAMKTLHVVESDVSGTVQRAVAANAAVVELGAELFIISAEPTSDV